MKATQNPLQHPKKERKNKKTPQTEFDRLKTNSVLFFQIGLIMVLLTTYTLLEMQFEVKTIDLTHNTPKHEDPETFVLTNFTIEQPKQPKPIKKIVKKAKPKVKHPTKIDVVTDDSTLKNDLEDNLFSDEDEPTPSTSPIDEGSLNIEKPVEIPNIMSVEFVPVFPGCEKQKDRAGKLKCMSKKMSKFIQKRFDTNLASDLGLSGKQKINVLFKIDENGNVTELKARAPHDKLEEEAKRVVKQLPKMTPGKQGNKSVSVMYALPILFQVQ